MEFELILRGGSVVDGTGAEPIAADVAVASGRIAGVGRLDGARGVAEVDVTGRYLMPGLVDTHVHLEGLLDDPSSWLALLRQGVTTVVLGQDGLSFAPASFSTVHYVQRYFGTVTGPPPAGLREGASVSSLLQWYDLRAPVNVAYLVPAGTVRHEVVGTAARPATVDELGAMVALVRHGMADGAVGLSTGLEYVPGAFADTAELVAMCVPVADAGGVYVSHLRSYRAAGIGAAMAELRDIVAGSGVGGHASHYRGPSAVLGPLLDGFDVTFDSYPYLVGSTILAMRALPASLQAGGPEATLDRLADRDMRRRLASQWEADTSLRRVVLAFVGDGRFASAEGLALADAAERFGLSFGEFVGDLLVDSRLAVACVLDATPSSGPKRTFVRCCAARRTWVVRMGSTPAATRIPAATARSRGSSVGTPASWATGPGGGRPCTWPAGPRGDSGWRVAACSRRARWPTSRSWTRPPWPTGRPTTSRAASRSAWTAFWSAAYRCSWAAS